MEKVKISLVSYLNSRPFVYGLNHSNLINDIILSLDYPALCAEKMISKSVDLGLVPVAMIPQIKNAAIVSDYCIGATGTVQSVLLVSDVPLAEIKTVILDRESRTSVLLARLLAVEFWKIKPQWIPEAGEGFQKAKGNTAAVIIGDRALNERSRFNYIYDLSEEWFKMTGLPFVFACWVANKHLDRAFLVSFNAALKYGISHIDDMAGNELLSESEKNYLTRSIQYELNENKRKGLELYLKLIRQFN